MYSKLHKSWNHEILNYFLEVINIINFISLKAFQWGINPVDIIK